MEIFISKYILLITHLLGISSEGNSYLFSNNSPKKITYNWWERLWRIFKFLRRSRKKRKQERKKKKHDKQSEKQKQKRFVRRKRWRKFKVVIKSFFRKKKMPPSKRAIIQRQKFLKRWRKRRRQRLFKVYLKGFTKRKKISKRKLEYFARIQKEQAFERYRKKRIYRFIFKRNIQIFKDVLRGKGFPKKKRPSQTPLWKQVWYPKQMSITVNSLMFFLLSYFFIAFFDKLSMSITSLLFDYKTVIYYYKIEFLVDYDDWFADSVKAVFATGPIMGLLIALLSMIIYSIVYLETGLLKNLLLWSVFHGINRIVSGALVGSMIGKGFGYVVMYLYYSDTGKLIMSLLMISISVIVGTVSTKYWVMTANSYYNYSKPHNRQLYMLNQLLLPYIFGNIIIYLINLPKFVYYDFLVNIFMIFMIIPPLLLNKYQQEYYFDEEPKSIKISIKTLLFAIAFIGIYRILLDIGLRIG